MNADAAAALLGTSPVTLSLWEHRFGYPVPVRSTDGQPLYPEAMMIALRDALDSGLSIAWAMTEARRLHPARRRAPDLQSHPGHGSLDHSEQAR